MTFLRFALLRAAVLPAAFAAAAEPADAEGRAATLARELARAQTTLRETQDTLAKQSAEIAAVRAEAAATRIQLGKAQTEAAGRAAASGANPSDDAALERERTAHIATKAVLAQREAQVQDMAAERTRLESELRVLKTSTELAKAGATAETKAILSQNADLAARSAVLTRELNSAKSEITTVRHELREQGAKAANAAEALQLQLAASQKSLGAARAELRQAQTALEAAATAKTQIEAQQAALQRRVAGLEREAQTAAAGAGALRERLEKAEAAPKPTPADVAAMQIQERQLAALEQELTTTRTQLAQTRSALESALVNAAKPGEAAAEAQLKNLRETNSSLQRELTATIAAARMQDRPTITEGELALLRERAAAARDLGERVQQLEAERAALVNPNAPVAVAAELERLEAARSAAENKLNTVLRSYTLLARERDAWRDQAQQRSSASARPDPTYPVEPVGPAASARAVTRRDSAPVPVSFGGNEDPVPVLTVTRMAPPAPAPVASPGSLPLGQPAFSHRIAPGETLSSIARRYYGNPKRWPEIVAANRDVLPDQRSFAAGKMIRIP